MDIDVRAERGARRNAAVVEPQVHPYPAETIWRLSVLRPPHGENDARLSEQRTAARASIAVARRELAERSAEMGVPVVHESHVAVEIHGVLEARSRGVERLPVVAVELRPSIDAARALEGEGAPRAPVEHVGASEIADVVHLEARRLSDDARLEACDAAAVLAELELLGVAAERRTVGVERESSSGCWK